MPKPMTSRCITVLLIIVALCSAKDIFSKTEVEFPAWCKDEIAKLDKAYTIVPYLHPTFITADLTGDGTEDIAIAITGPKNKKGVFIINQETKKKYFLGAGTEFGNGGDEWAWLVKWKLYTEKTANQTQFDQKTGDITGSKAVILKHNAIELYELSDGTASAVALLYWDGKKYTWIHQGE
jgi:hypothetical protein